MSLFVSKVRDDFQPCLSTKDETWRFGIPRRRGAIRGQSSRQRPQCELRGSTTVFQAFRDDFRVMLDDREPQPLSATRRTSTTEGRRFGIACGAPRFPGHFRRVLQKSLQRLYEDKLELRNPS